MKISILLLVFLFPLLTNGIAEVALGAVCKKLFAETVITGTISFVFDMGKMVGEKVINFINDAKDDGSKKMNVSLIATVEKKTEMKVLIEEEDEEVDSKDEILKVAQVVHQTNEKMKASFKSVKFLMRYHHFQTHIQFPVESLILHLEQFISHPSNATQEDLRITCEKVLPNTILKNVELMLKDTFLPQQSENNPEMFAKIEKGISILVKQIIFAQSVCLQIRHLNTSEDVHKVFAFHMAKNIEFYIKKQKIEVETKVNLNAVFVNVLSNKNAVKTNARNASMYEGIGKNLCQIAKSPSSNVSIMDFFLSPDNLNFTIITKNRYMKESFNGWKIYIFIPKMSLKPKTLYTNENDEMEDAEKQLRSKSIIENQIIFECPQNSKEEFCSLNGGKFSGMFSSKNTNFNYAICGNVGVTIGHPIPASDRKKAFEEAQKLTPEERENAEKWEKTKGELTEFLKSWKIKKTEAEEKRTAKTEEMIEAKIAKVLEEMDEKDEIKVVPMALNNASNKSALVFVNFFFIAIYYYLFL